MSMNENCLCVLVMTKTAKVSVSGVGLGLDPAGLGLGLGLRLPGLDNISAIYSSLWKLMINIYRCQFAGNSNCCRHVDGLG